MKIIAFILAVIVVAVVLVCLAMGKVADEHDSAQGDLNHRRAR